MNGDIKQIETYVAECCIRIIQNGIPRGVSSPENIQSWNHIADIADKFNIKLPLEEE